MLQESAGHVYHLSCSRGTSVEYASAQVSCAGTASLRLIAAEMTVARGLVIQGSWQN